MSFYMVPTWIRYSIWKFWKIHVLVSPVGCPTIIWFLCPLGGQAYEELPSGELCSDGREIKSEGECRKAAETLQMKFAHAWTGSGDFPGCLIANDGRNAVYFNLSPTPSTTANNPRYGAICIKSTRAGNFFPLWLEQKPKFGRKD